MSVIEFLPAQLKSNSHGWYIEYQTFNPNIGKMQRFRTHVNVLRKHYPRLADFKAHCNGIINTIFGTAVMFAFYNLLHFDYWVSSAANYFFGSILSYFLNKYFTFHYRERSWKVIMKFTVKQFMGRAMSSDIYSIAQTEIKNRQKIVLHEKIIDEATKTVDNQD